MARRKKFNIDDLIKDFIDGKVVFEEVYSTINKYEINKPKYAVDILINRNVQAREMITYENKVRLVEFVQKDGDESFRYLNHGVKNRNISEMLIDTLLKLDSTYVIKLLGNREYLKYIIKNCDTESNYSYGLVYRLNDILSTAVGKYREELFNIIIERYELVELVLKFSGNNSKFSDKEKKEIYDRYKGRLFSNRKGYVKLKYNCDIMYKHVEYVYIKRVVEKVVNALAKGKRIRWADEFLNDVEKFNITQDQRDELSGYIMMAKIVG